MNFIQNHLLIGRLKKLATLLVSLSLLTGFFFKSAEDKAKEAAKLKEYQMRQYKIDVKNATDVVYEHLDRGEVAALRSKKSYDQFKYALAVIIAEHLVADRSFVPDGPD